MDLEAAHARIAELESAVAERDAVIARLVARLEQLEAKVARLERNSSNSSKPPSSDLPGLPRQQPKGPTGKPRGGQPGHKRAMRELVPAEHVTECVALVPATCVGCSGPLCGYDPAPQRHQVVELAPVNAHVTEYAQHALICQTCGTTTRAPLPAGVPRGHFGPRLTAFVALLSAKYRLSKRAVRACLHDIAGISIALGMVAKAERHVAVALEHPVADAHAYVQAQAAVALHADETSWRQEKKRAWLWVAATQLVTVFLIATHRSAAVARQLIGESFAGTLVTDRWSAYNWFDCARRQLCWAHLKRDFQAWVDGGTSAGQRFGQALLAQTAEMFRLWHRVRDGTLDRKAFQKAMEPIQLEMATILESAAACRTSGVVGSAKEMLKLSDALWTFVDVEGVEPTNNFGERQIRHAVMWRKTSFGTDSLHGSRFAERMLTVCATLRSQQRNVLDFLTAACAARITNTKPPSLLPIQATAIDALAA